MTISRSTVAGMCMAALASSAFLGFNEVAARDFPTKPVRFIVPFAPGGNTDVQGRFIANRLTATLGQQVIVDNRPGAGGTLGMEMAARAPADGYTLVLGSFGSVLLAPSLYAKLRYDPEKDLAPVILLSTPPSLIVTNPAVPAKSVRELIAHARANPNKLNYGSAGNGSFAHLSAELFRSMAKIQIAHVPYKGAAPALTDLLGNQIQLVFAPFPAALPHVNGGRLNALAVTGDKRSPVLPQAPTAAESGLPGYEASGWFAVMAPAGTPKAIVTRINQDINRVFADPEVRAAFAADGSEPVGGTPEQLAQSIREGLAKWAKLVRELGVQL